MRQLKNTNPRMIVLPLIIVAAAFVLWSWGAQQAVQQARDVEQFIEALCENAQIGGGPRCAAAQSVVGKSALQMLQSELEVEPDPVIFRVVVESGDHSEFADGAATHTAIIELNGDDILGLRIHHGGDPSQLQIIGLWQP